MGYGFYTVADGMINERPGGYYVIATCDKRGCNEEINRGLAYLCGEHPHAPDSDEAGCGKYFCEKDRGFVGIRGGCRHDRWTRLSGETLICEAVRDSDGAICCRDKRTEYTHWVDYGDDSKVDD